MCLIAYDDGDAATYVHVGYSRRAKAARRRRPSGEAPVAKTLQRNPRIGRKFDLEGRPQMSKSPHWSAIRESTKPQFRPKVEPREPSRGSQGRRAGTTGPRPRPAGQVTSYLFSDVPAERRSSQASTTRFAMPASATFPQARGSYAFLLPTSPSTLSTPS